MAESDTGPSAIGAWMRRFGETTVAKMMAMGTWQERLAFLLALDSASRRDARDRVLVGAVMRALKDRGWLTEAGAFTEKGLQALGVAGA